MLGFIPRDQSRQLTYVANVLFALAGCVLTFLLARGAGWTRILTIGLGYVSLAQILFTLAIGTGNLILRPTLRRNPVNINLRRDTGIFAGISGALHVVLGLQVHRGGDIVQYFFERTHQGLKPLTDVFGFANYTGTAATVLLVALLLLSNDICMRLLKGPLWKWLQRLNYFLVLLVLAHTFGYQIEVQRPPAMPAIVVGLVLIALLLQGAGLAISLARLPAQKRTVRHFVPGLGLSAMVLIACAGLACGLTLTGVQRLETALPTHAPPQPPAHGTQHAPEHTPAGHATPYLPKEGTPIPAAFKPPLLAVHSSRFQVTTCTTASSPPALS